MPSTPALQLLRPHEGLLSDTDALAIQGDIGKPILRLLYADPTISMKRIDGQRLALLSGHRLEVKIETSAAAYANIVVAYDTTSFPSSVGLP